jgi:hypothetical protein
MIDVGRAGVKRKKKIQVRSRGKEEEVVRDY